MKKPRQFSDQPNKFTSEKSRRFVNGKLSRGEDNQDMVVAVDLPNVLEIGARVLGQTMEQLTEENPYVHQVGHFQIASSVDAVEACCREYPSPWGGFFWTYREYEYAVSHVDSWQQKLNTYRDNEARVESVNQEAQARYEHQKQQAEERYHNKLAKADYGDDVVLNEPFKPHDKDAPSLHLGAHEIMFTNNFRRADHTPNLQGYLTYICDQSEEFYKKLHTPLPAYLSEDMRKMHTYLLGASGSGKSELLKTIIYSYITQKFSSVVVLDPNSDFAEEIAQWSILANDPRLVYLKSNLETGYSFTINPFEISGVPVSDKSIEANEIRGTYAQELADALVEIIGGGGEFTVNMHTLIKPCVLVLLEHEGATLRDLLRFVNDADNSDLVALGASMSYHTDIATFFISDSEFKHKSYDPTKNAVGKKIRYLLNFTSFGNMTCGKSTVDIEKMCDEKRVIIFNLSKGDLGESGASAFGRFMVATMKSMAMRRAKIEKLDRVPVHFFMDECHNFLSPSIKTMMSEARKYAVHLSMAHQYFGKDMTTSMKNVVGENAFIKITGTASAYSADKTVNIFDTDRDTLLSLDRGRYLVSVSGKKNPNFVFSGLTNLLGSSGGAPPDIWAHTIDQQKRFYRDVSHVPEDGHDYPFGDQPDKEIMKQDKARGRDEDDFFSSDHADPLGFN